MSSEPTLAPSASPGSAGTDSVLSGPYRSITISTLALVAVAAFDGMAVPAALPNIAGDLGVRGLPLVLTAFSLTSTISLLAAGPIIDAIGVRRTYRVTLLIFFASTLLCAAAPNLILLVVARAVQGLGGGLIMAVALSNVGLSYPPELRPRALAMNSSVWGVMALAGPAAAAFLLSVLSWRGVFLITLPIVALCGLIGWNRMAASGPATKPVMDFRGLALLGAFSAIMLAGLSELRWWSLAAVGIAGVLAWVYWRHSGHHPEPVLNRRHFAGWPFGALNFIPLAFFAGTLSLDGFLPIFVQGALGRSNTVAAFAVAALAIGWTSGSHLSSMLVRRFANVDLMVAGFVLVLPALIVGAVTYTATVPLAVVLLLSFLQGLGVGSITNVTVTLLQQAAASSEMGRVSAAHQFARHVGVTLGAALAGAILFGSVAQQIGTVEPVRRLLANEDVEIADTAREAIARGFRLATVAAIVITCIGLGVALNVRRRFRAQR